MPCAEGVCECRAGCGTTLPTASQSRRAGRGQQVLEAALLRDQGTSSEASPMTFFGGSDLLREVGQTGIYFD